MADTKVSALTDGATANATDRIPVARSPFGATDNRYITPAYLRTYLLPGSGSEIIYKSGTAFGAVPNSSISSNGMPTWGAGTITASDPFTITQTLNSGAVTFTGFKISLTDTASASGSLFADFQVGGTSKFKVSKTGAITVADPGYMNSAVYSSSSSNSGFGFNVGVPTINRSGTEVASANYNAIEGSNLPNFGATCLYVTGFTNAPSGTAPGSGALLISEAANSLSLRNGTNAQTFRLYNTTDRATTNYERAAFTWSSNVCYLKNENGGTGSARLFVPVTGSTTVASLPSAATAGAGARAMVTDANATTFLSTVAGGGANKVPVVSDGTNWLIG